MSEPVSNAEVEDVLSSIRRLVSEDKRPLQSSNSAPERAEPLVAPPKSAAPEADAEISAPAPDPSVASGDFAPHVPQQPTASADKAAGDPSPKERPFFSARKPITPPREKAPETAADRLVLTQALRVATSDGKDRPQPTASQEVEEKAGPEISPFDYDMLHDDPADLHAEDYAAPEDAPAQPEADPSAQDSREEPPVAEPDQPFASARFTHTEPPKAERKLSDKIAALETAIGQISDNWEPDSPGDDDYSGTEPPAMAWEDDVEDDVEAPQPEASQSEAPQPEAPRTEAEPEASEAPAFRRPTPEIEEQVRRFADSGPRAPEPAPRPAEAAPDAAGGLGVEDQFLDEEALRDLVTEIVRAELQGALGERITRNVRKLVRREIHRAMTAQDLE